MNPNNISFNALIVGPKNSGKSRFVVDQIYGPFRGKLENIMLVCPTFVHNKTYFRIGENDPRIFVIICVRHDEEAWLKFVSLFFEGTNTLIIVDDCAVSKDVKGCTGQLVHPGFRPRERGGDRSLLHTFGEDHEGHI